MNYIIGGLVFIQYRFLQTKCETYTSNEVSSHCDEDDAWVTYNNKVYDITKFIKLHPGGNYINMSLGGDISYYINYFGVHLLNNDFFNLLQKYKIGELNDNDNDNNNDNDNDNDNNNNDNDNNDNDVMKINIKYPLECEPYYIPFNFITPLGYKYIRNHANIPKVNNKIVSIYYDDIFLENVDIDKIEKKYIQKQSFYNTIQCCGNRIDEKQSLKQFNNYDISSKGMIYNSKFSGYSLDCIIKLILLKHYNKINNIYHIEFEGNDLYKTSVPIDYLDKTYIIDKMDDLNLLPVYGGPLRTIVKGTVGCRNVKWTNTIRMSSKESDSPWQQHFYRNNGKPIYNYPINSIITSHNNHDYVYNKKTISVKGVAHSINSISDVYVYYNGQWNKAKVYKNSDIYSWNLWEIDLDIEDNHKNIILKCKAYDINGNTQPNIINLDNIYINNSVQCLELIRY